MINADHLDAAGVMWPNVAVTFGSKSKELPTLAPRPQSRIMQEVFVQHCQHKQNRDATVDMAKWLYFSTHANEYECRLIPAHLANPGTLDHDAS